jgi:hypothetical protein
MANAGSAKSSWRRLPMGCHPGGAAINMTSRLAARMRRAHWLVGAQLLMQENLLSLFYLLSRYVHIVAACVVVGGTLFYELVVPIAIGELKNETQLALIGRMRWVFRWVVYTAAAALILTGIISAHRNWYVFSGDYVQFLSRMSGGTRTVEDLEQVSVLNRPMWLFAAHLIAGVLSLVIAVALVSGGRPPNRPIQWMKLNVLLLLLAIFFASASRNARQRLFEAVRTGESPPASAPD